MTILESLIDGSHRLKEDTADEQAFDLHDEIWEANWQFASYESPINESALNFCIAEFRTRCEDLGLDYIDYLPEEMF